jgi:hypothetical protein
MMPPSFYCKPRCLKAGGRLTENSLAPPTKVAFMNNQSKKCLSERHCGNLPGLLFFILMMDEYHQLNKDIFFV